MKRMTIVSALVLAAACATVGTMPGSARLMGCCEAAPSLSLQASALEALGTDKAKAESAIEALRGNGYAGVDALLAVAPADPKSTPFLKTPQSAEVLRFRAAIDRVTMQKDAWMSHLYWYTDLEAAKAEAARTGKPILSLRMLGKLNEDLSCANSRFFRTTLYANGEISKYLREHFILHWESVRPVPVVTIDMGDGRVLTRTLTGNSIHYVLDSRGRVVDGIPGLYGPMAFLRQARMAESEALAVGGMEDGAFVSAMKGYEGKRVEEIRAAWERDLRKAQAAAVLTAPLPVMAPVVQGKAPGALEAEKGAARNPTAVEAGKLTDTKYAALESWIIKDVANGANPPGALEAGKVAMGKGRIEIPLLVSIGAKDSAALEKATDEGMWLKIAALHQEDAKLDASATALMREKVPAEVAMPVAISKAYVESPLVKMVRNLEGSIALDTVKNEYRLHAKICEWLGASEKPVELKKFNERVYAELFLTPSSDPWLGLAPADAFAAIDGGGVCLTAKR